jgi:hypothetical protein
VLCEADESGQPLHARIARQLATLAADGDLRAIREVFDRIDGSPVRATLTDDEPIRLNPIVLQSPTAHGQVVPPP